MIRVGIGLWLLGCGAVFAACAEDGMAGKAMPDASGGEPTGGADLTGGGEPTGGEQPQAGQRGEGGAVSTDGSAGDGGAEPDELGESCELVEGASNGPCGVRALLQCGGACTDPRTDVGYCGATGDCQAEREGDVCRDADQVCARGTCRAPRAFAEPLALDDGTHGLSLFAPLAITPSGEAMVIWTGYHPNSDVALSTNEIWASQFAPATGWKKPFLVDAKAPGADTSPHVTLDAQGNAMSIWNERVGAGYEVWTRRFDAVSGWSTSALLATPGDYDAFNPRLASDAEGNVIASWYESRNDAGPLLDMVWSARYVPGAGWSTPERLDSGSAQGIFGQDLAVAPNGEAIAIWDESDGEHHSVWTRRFTRRDGWAAAELLEEQAGDSFSSHVTFDRKGNAFATWYQQNGAQASIWVRRYRAGCGWQSAQELHRVSGGAYVPHVATGPDGEAFVTWYERAGGTVEGGTLDIWTARYELPSGWQPAQLVSSSGRDAFMPEVAIDDDGRALLVWQDGPYQDSHATMSSYDKGRGWSKPAPLQTAQRGSADRAHVGFLPNGDALTVWTEGDRDQRQVYARLYR